MASYLEAVKSKLNELSTKNTKSTEKETNNRANWFKPEVGKEYEVRFLPYLDKNNQPFEEVLYYNNINLILEDGKPKAKRIVAPFQYGLTDPISSFLTELQKKTKGRTEEHKNTWKEWNRQRAKPRFYALIIVRGGDEEKKGPHIMELSQDECVAAYTAFTHKDLVEENVMDVNEGYDFTLTCAPDPQGKTFLGKPVRKITFTARRKPTKLGTKVQVEEWLKVVEELNLSEFFKRMAPNEEKVQTILDNYVHGTVSEPTSFGAKEMETARNADPTTDKMLTDAFADLE